MKSIFALTLSLLGLFFVSAQVSLAYQQPSEEIRSLVDVSLAPTVLFNQDKSTMVLLYRDSYKTIQELSEKELRLGGLRINPKTNIGSRVNYYNNVAVQSVGEDSVTYVKGLPENPRLTNFSWSPDEQRIALTNTTENGVEVWVLDIETGTVQKYTDANVNANMRDVINWFKDSKRFLVKMLPDNRQPLIDTKSTVPTGPTISVNDGKKAQNRTYQDLLKNPVDEHNFEQLALSKLVEVDVVGNQKDFLPVAMYGNISFSPDGQYVRVTTIEKPFSYIVPYRRFPSKTIVYDQNAAVVKMVSATPLMEELPKGFMSTQKEPRGFNWRSDRPSTLYYTLALDGGDPVKQVEYRDEVFEWDAPFDSPPRSLLKTINRFAGIQWGNNSVAIAYDRWWNTRNTKTYLFNPSDVSQAPKIISDRNYQDVYSDPGSFLTEKNRMGVDVLSLRRGKLILIGDGYSKEGQFPFVDELNSRTLVKTRRYTSALTDKLEEIIDYDRVQDRLLVRQESKSDFPNYFFYSLKDKKTKQLTAFQNPFDLLQGVHKEVITYTRNDGLALSGTLYLPVGHTTKTAKNLPMILWAYPREYKDKKSAAQSTQNPNEFTYPYWGSPVYWVTKGYVVLANAAFPIVGEADTEPNDSFRTQLVANAAAAIAAVDNMGYIDRKRVAVGGHSYGAFMVANLLSHSDLFAAGIARSGAYNRTLTPFGFQSEERSYWEAPEIYYTMSPFMHADKMKTPLLLVHGEADNNSGTYPLQSIRYFNALKGLGATVRLVMLPKESHGYRAKESILHLLWEQDQWLEKYLK